MLYDADPTISTPLALHAFRRVYWNDRLRDFEATSIGVGVTRVPLDSVSALLSDLDAPGQDDMDLDTVDQKHGKKTEGPSTTKLLGLDILTDEIDERAAAITCKIMLQT